MRLPEPKEQTGYQLQADGASATARCGGLTPYRPHGFLTRLLGGGVGDEVPQPVPELLVTVVVAASGAPGELQPGRVAVRCPP